MTRTGNPSSTTVLLYCDLARHDETDTHTHACMRLVSGALSRAIANDGVQSRTRARGGSGGSVRELCSGSCNKHTTWRPKPLESRGGSQAEFSEKNGVPNRGLTRVVEGPPSFIKYGQEQPVSRTGAIRYAEREILCSSVFHMAASRSGFSDRRVTDARALLQELVAGW